MSDATASLTLDIDATGVKSGIRSLDDLAAAGARAEVATGNMADEFDEAVRSLAAMSREAMGAGNALKTVEGQHVSVSKAAGLTSHQMLNLTRQFSDVGVSAAMGMSPLLILVQQGPQIAEVFKEASIQGVSFKSALGSIAASLAPVAVPLIAIGAVVGTAAAGFGLLHRELSKGYPTDITDGLGLTEKQLERVESRTVTFGDTFRATFNVIGRHIMNGPVGQALTWLRDAMGRAFDWIAKKAIDFGAVIAGSIAVVVRFGNMARLALTGQWGEVARQTQEGVGDTFRAAAGAFRTGAAALGQQIQTEAVRIARDRALEEAGKADPARTSRARKDAIDKEAEATKKLIAELERLAESYMTPEERAVKRLTDDLALLDRGVQQGLVTAQEYWALLMKMRGAQNVVEGLIKPLQVEDLVPVADTTAKLEEIADQARFGFENAAYDFGRAFSDAYHDIGSRDWMAALGGLFTAVKKLKTEWGSLTTEGRLGAAAGIAGAAGSMIGGKAGGALSGAASGAMLGMQLTGGNPLGAALGGAIGFVSSLFGGNKAKKRAEAERKAAEAAEAARKALEIANQKRDLEIQIMQLQGNVTGALTLQRQAELDAMDASNRALAEQVFALQDAQEQRALEIRLMEAQGDAVGALAARRRDELDATREALRPLLETIYAAEDAAAAKVRADQLAAEAEAALAQARQDAAAAVNAARGQLAASYNAEKSALEATRGRFAALADSLGDFRRSLDFTQQTAAATVSAAQAQFRETASLAQLGNEEALGQLQNASERYIEVGRAQAKTMLDQLRIEAEVKQALDRAQAVAVRQVDMAQRQLDALDAQVSGLLEVNESVLSVRDAVAALQGALAKQAELIATAQAPLVVQPQTAEEIAFQAHSDAMLAEYLRQQAAGEDWAQRPTGFSTGGSFKVGGSGAEDSKLFKLALSPGEMVSVRRPGEDGNGEIAAAISGLRAEVAALRQGQAEGNRHAKKTADILTTVTRGGEAMQIGSDSEIPVEMRLTA